VGTAKDSTAQVSREVELHIPSELGWERVAISAASSVAERMGFPPERIEDIKTAVAEATLNAIEHGNAQDATRKVYISLASEEEELQIGVLDHSTKPFVPATGADQRPDLTAKLAGQAPLRGWGTFLIHALVDEVEYSSTNSGNLVRMIIHLEPRSRLPEVTETTGGQR
jgi:serine/threonine-protein kinase RsbW